MNFSKLSLYAFPLFLWSATAAMAMPVFSEEKEQAVIVIPDNPSQITRYAATELVKFLNASTEGDFQLKKESEVLAQEGPYRIYVGASKAAAKKGIDIGKLKKNHFVTLAAPEALYLVGRDDAHAEAPIDDWAEMGSLLAVYDWLDRAAGVRWVWPGELGTEIPRHKELATEEGPPQYGKPAVAYTRLRFYAALYNQGLPSAYGRSRSLDDQSYLKTSEWFRRHKVYRTAGERSFYNHGFAHFWERYGKEHPEYFALRPDGKRGPVDKRTYLTQMCVSNPELPKVVVQEWLQTRTEELPWINACENDRRTIDPTCYCDGCKAWDVPEAKVSVQDNPWHIESRAADQIDAYETVSKTDRYMRFLLAIQEEGRKHDPNAKVVGYAYSSYSDPPVRTKLNKDIIIYLIPPYVYPLEKGREAEARKLWDDWKATGATLIYRPNDFLVGYPVPYVYANQFGTDFRHYLDNGMFSSFFDSFTGLWGTQGPNLYMLGRLHSRPDLSPSEIMEEYYSIFGPAKESIREYIAYWESVTAKCTVKLQEQTKGGWNYMMVAGPKIFTPDAYAEGKRLLAKAKEAAGEEGLPAQRVEYLRIWLEHADLTTQTVAAYHAMRASSAPLERLRFNKILQQLRAFRSEHEASFIGADWSFIRHVEPWTNWKE